MSTFDRDMPGKEIVANNRAYPYCRQCCCSRYEAVDNDRNSGSCPSYDHTHQSSDLQAAYFAQYIEWVAGIRNISCQSTFNDVYLVSKLRFIDTCSPSGDQGYRDPC